MYFDWVLTFVYRKKRRLSSCSSSQRRLAR